MQLHLYIFLGFCDCPELKQFFFWGGGGGGVLGFGEIVLKSTKTLLYFLVNLKLDLMYRFILNLTPGAYFIYLNKL